MNQNTLAYRAVGVLDTPNAPSMLFKLCKHFAKKIDVDFDEQRGFARFPQGECEFRAELARLGFVCSADSEAELVALKKIVDLHVALMTRREPRQIVWTHSTG